jgi:hypothetical protein
MNNFKRPGLLTFGIVLTVLHALMMMAVFVFVLLTVMGVATVGMVEAPSSEMLPIGIVFSLGGFVIGFFVLFYAAVLWVCYSSWGGSRLGLALLIGLSGLGLINSGPISAVIGVLTIIGCVQAWERSPKFAS